jgi:hypothetical protein
MTQHPLTPSDLAWLRYFRRREAEGFGPLRPGLRPSSRRAVLDVIRCAALAAHAAILDRTAARPAVRVVRQPDDGSVREIPAAVSARNPPPAAQPLIQPREHTGASQSRDVSIPSAASQRRLYARGFQ